jgi:hypothetical protein
MEIIGPKRAVIQKRYRIIPGGSKYHMKTLPARKIERYHRRPEHPKISLRNIWPRLAPSAVLGELTGSEDAL